MHNEPNEQFLELQPLFLYSDRDSDHMNSTDFLVLRNRFELVVVAKL